MLTTMLAGQHGAPDELKRRLPRTHVEPKTHLSATVADVKTMRKPAGRRTAKPGAPSDVLHGKQKRIAVLPRNTRRGKLPELSANARKGQLETIKKHTVAGLHGMNLVDRATPPKYQMKKRSAEGGVKQDVLPAPRQRLPPPPQKRADVTGPPLKKTTSFRRSPGITRMTNGTEANDQPGRTQVPILG